MQIVPDITPKMFYICYFFFLNLVRPDIEKGNPQFGNILILICTYMSVYTLVTIIRHEKNNCGQGSWMNDIVPLADI